MRVKRCIEAVLVVLVGCALLMSPTDGLAQGFGKVKSKAPPKEATIPEDLAPEKVDGFLAGLSDEQARKVLAAELKKKAAAKSDKGSKDQIVGKETGLVLAFFAAQGALSSLSDQIGRIVSGAETSAETDVWEKLIGGRGSSPFLTSMGFLAFIVLVGLAAERLLLRKTERLRRQLLEAIPRGGWEKAGIILSRLILSSLGIVVYVLVSFAACSIIYWEGPATYLVSSAVIVSYYFRVIEMATRLITSPNAPELRLVIMSDADASLLYNWIIGITASVIPSSVLALALKKSGGSRELFLFVYSTAGPIMSTLLAVMIWQVRRRVATLICPLEEPDSTPARLLRQRCADFWHLPAIVFALAVGAYWWARVLIHADATILRLIVSLFLIPFCIGMDQWLQAMLTSLRGKPREVIDLSPSDEDEEKAPEQPIRRGMTHRGTFSEKDMSIYFPLIRKTFRGVLLVFLFFAALELWSIDFDIGWLFARSVLGVIIALLIGVIAWEVVKARIDRRIEEEAPFQSDEAEEGGAGGSRTGTLLLLLRKFILVFLLVVVGFSVLASLGVNIAPLLAGAGVIGLAIGFGSQTLVRDIIAGIFFLIDDAFRVGDYVEAGTAKGTVEHISLRSVRLRHPRGPISVVPFGALKMVKNFTRDYIIEKLDVRVRFDTDPDVIRKIVKKLNKDIRADEEFAGFLLSDIKSAGVRAIDDSAMIIRVKFRCIPGEQFILRREVFHRLQRAFKEKGIEFADRNVTVYLPQQPASAEGPASPGGARLPLAAAGAAAAAAIAQAEAEALAKATATKKSEE